MIWSYMGILPMKFCQYRYAYFYKLYKELCYFYNHNAYTTIYCKDIKTAKLIVKNSNIEQELKIYKSIF